MMADIRREYKGKCGERDGKLQEKFILCQQTLTTCETNNKTLKGDVARCNASKTTLQTQVKEGLTNLNNIQLLTADNNVILERIQTQAQAFAAQSN